MGKKEEKKKLADIKKAVTESREARSKRMQETDGGRMHRQRIVPSKKGQKLEEAMRKDVDF